MEKQHDLMENGGVLSIGKQEGTRLWRSAVLYALFLLFSLFGWVLEIVFFAAKGKGLTDRGFLSLPLCPVYGVSIVSTFLLLGTPQRMRLGRRSLSHLSLPVRYLLYLVLGGVIATLWEGLVGVALNGLFGVVMWDYRGMPLSLYGYICLPFALIWGVLMLAFMRYLFPPILSYIEKIEKATLYLILVPLTFSFLFDLSFNSTYAYIHRLHFSLY